MDSLEIFILIANAAGNPGFETSSALSFRFSLKMVWTPVPATPLASLEKSTTSKFIAGRANLLVNQIQSINGVRVYVFKILCLLQDHLGGSIQLHQGSPAKAW